MATIVDLAAYTGLSLGTISKYLNGGSVRAGNEAKIREAIKTLNFEVNTLARGLKTNKFMNVGILLHHWESLFFMRIISIIENSLFTKGYNLIVCAYNGVAQQEQEKLKMLLGRCDAVVIMPMSVDGDFIRANMVRDVIIISMDRLIKDYECDAIVGDKLNTSYSVMEYLLTRGHRRICVLLGTKGLYTVSENERGIQRICEDYGLSSEQCKMVYGDFREETGYKLVKKLLENEEYPSAVYATTAEMTIGAMRAIQEKNLNIPDDISLIGTDNITNVLLTNHSICQVVQPPDEYARSLSDILLRRLQGDKSTYPALLRLKSTFVYMDSVAEIKQALPN